MVGDHSYTSGQLSRARLADFNLSRAATYLDIRGRETQRGGENLFRIAL